MKKGLGIILGAFGAVGALGFAASSYFFGANFKREKKKKSTEAFFAKLERIGLGDYVEKIKKGRAYAESLPCENVYITSRDGLRLHARYYENNPESNRIIVLAHGYKSSGFSDFSCAFEMYREMGFNFLMIDQRAHGESEGKYICFGVKERYDVADWCDYLVDRFGDGVEIVLDGMSMGCTTVILAAALPDISKNVCGVIGDCGFTDPYTEIAHVAKSDFHLPPFPAVHALWGTCRLRAGFGFRDASTVEAVKNISVPILFVHGEADDFVPCENSRRNFEACTSEKKRIFTVPGATHGVSFLVDEEGCRRAITEFMADVDEYTAKKRLA